ncbi:MAG: hypothetical protein AAGA85_23040 [Bacteroidota bacterium]
MRKDIPHLPVEDVYVAVAKEGEDWRVYLLNRSPQALETILVTSKGYGEKDGQEQKTSVLRHAIPRLDPQEYALLEPIDADVFHLNNEYWVSFYIGSQIYDKKYIFVPDSIVTGNLSYIPELRTQGVLHT